MSAAFDINKFDDEFVIPTMIMNIDDEYLKGDKRQYFSAPTIDLDIYESVIVLLSGGKDSIACIIALIDQGVDMSKVEFWHHDVDGREGSTLMDWAFMRDYNVKLAEHFGVPIYFSWLQGGFEGEMLKENAFSQPHKVETPSGLITLPRTNKITKRTGPSTRRRFPQQSASLATRWCSSSVKIDVGRRAITNQERFNHSRTLVVSGERRQESSNRAKYNQLEYHTQDIRHGKKGRVVDAWRPVLHWSEEAVWNSIERHNIIAPLPYQLGWSRSSCKACIYNDDLIWSTINHYFPQTINKINNYEIEFDTTISRTKKTVLERVKGVAPIITEDPLLIKQAITEEYFMPVVLPAGEKWVMPKGAFKKSSCGSV